jgi:hypothetical protein
MTNNLLAFYVDRVFKDHQELDPQILRKVSSIANSFLYIQKTLQECVSQCIGIHTCFPSAPGSAWAPAGLLIGLVESKEIPCPVVHGRSTENLFLWSLLSQGFLLADISSAGSSHG